MSVLTFHLITYQAPRREREIKRQQPSERASERGVRGREERGRRGGVVLADQALEIAAPANTLTRKNAEAPSLPSQQMITLGNQCRRPNISSRPPTLCSVLRVARSRGTSRHTTMWGGYGCSCVTSPTLCIYELAWLRRWQAKRERARRGWSMRGFV